MPDVGFHPVAGIFPLMTEDDFDALVDDVRKHGLREEIDLFEGKILDGRNRYRACLLAGVEPGFREVHPEDPVAYVLSKNLHRRHLNESQRGMVAGRVKDCYAAEAKERQQEAAKKAGQASGARRRGETNVPANLPGRSEAGDARDRAGAALNVSGKTVDRAVKVLQAGTPELIDAVDRGEIAVSTAAGWTELPPERQAELATQAKPPKRRQTKTRSRGRKARGGSTRPAGRRSPRPDVASVRQVVDELCALVDKPALEVSIRDVKRKVDELREAVSRLAE